MTGAAVGVRALARRVVVVVEGVEPDDVVPVRGESLGEVRPDESGGAGDEVAHAQTSPGSAAIGSGSSSANGTSSAVLAGHEAEVGEEPRHHDAGPELPEARLGALAAGERERELRVAAPGRERQRKRAAEAGVDVRHRQRAVRLPEALDVGRADDPDRLRDARAVLRSARDPGATRP